MSDDISSKINLKYDRIITTRVDKNMTPFVKLSAVNITMYYLIKWSLSL
jgi:hypothetical protein